MLAVTRTLPQKTFFIRWLAASTLTALLTILLLQPAEKPVIDTGIPPGPPSLGRDIFFIAGHIILFGLLVVLWRWTLITRFTPQSALLIAVLIALIVGTTAEIAQNLIPDRSATLVDFLSNGVGALLAVVAIRYWESR
jgi:VanZ family protein